MWLGLVTLLFVAIAGVTFGNVIPRADSDTDSDVIPADDALNRNIRAVTEASEQNKGEKARKVKGEKGAGHGRAQPTPVPRDEVKNKRRKSRENRKKAVEELKKKCKGQACKTQKEEHKKKKGIAKKLYLRRYLKKFDGDQAKAEQETEKTMQTVLDIKKAFLDKLGVGDIVDPIDDGLFQHDILLNGEQAQKMKEAVIAADIDNDEEEPTPPTVARRKRGSPNLFFEIYKPYYWTEMPIPYIISADFSAPEKADLRGAFSDIQSQVPCITFKEVTSDPGKPHISLTRSTGEPGSCGGVSPLGKQPTVNQIDFTLDTVCAGNVLRKIAIHEFLHSLGVLHTQSREDRDAYVSIQWENIQPAAYDQYDTSPAKEYGTSYGIPYDYFSIMQYEVETFGVGGKPTMIPTQSACDQSGTCYTPEELSPIIGTAKNLSPLDKLLLKKVYCDPTPGCKDQHQTCGAWALAGYCATYPQVKTACPRSCGTSPCQSISS